MKREKYTTKGKSCVIAMAFIPVLSKQGKQKYSNLFNLQMFLFYFLFLLYWCIIWSVTWTRKNMMCTAGVVSYIFFLVHIWIVHNMFNECTATTHVCYVFFHPSSPEEYTMYNMLYLYLQCIPAVGISYEGWAWISAEEREQVFCPDSLDSCQPQCAGKLLEKIVHWVRSAKA